MSFGSRHVVACLCLSSALACAATAPAAPDDVLRRVQAHADTLADAFARGCPVADPASQAAYDDCRRAMFGSTALRARLPDFVLWGRQRDPGLPLADTKCWRRPKFDPGVSPTLLQL
jgi:hypothetical protein